MQAKVKTIILWTEPLLVFTKIEVITQPSCYAKTIPTVQK